MPDFTLECDRFFHAVHDEKPTYYSAYAIATNFNKDSVLLAAPPNLKARAGKYKRFMLEGISLYIASAAAGVAARPLVIPCTQPIQYMTGETKISEYMMDSLVWSNLHVPVDLNAISGITFVAMQMANYAATDDLTVYIWGYLE